MNIITALFTLILLLPAFQQETKIYEWRGTDRKGIYNESNLLKSWPAEGPKEIWSIDNIGNGFVSPIFTEDRFYITGEIDTMLILFSFNLKGEKQWQTTLGKEWMRSYPGSRSIPTIADDLIYVGSGLGNLYCVNKSDGKIVWSKDLVKDLNGILPLHGHSEAALIHDDKIFWTVGGKVNNVVAMNRFTGKLIWTNKGFGEVSGYNPGQLIEHGGKSIFVTFTSYHLMGFNTKNGKLLWSHEQENFPLEKRGPGYGDTHSNNVLYDNGYIYYVTGEGNGAVKLKLSDDGTAITQVWRNRLFDSYMGGSIKIGNFLYCGGTITPDLRSINAETGMLTDSLKIGTGAIIAADDMLYFYTQKGDLMLIGYNQGKIEKVSSFRIKKGNAQHFSHPVINNGVLYQRHGKVLMAFDIRK